MGIIVRQSVKSAIVTLAGAGLGAFIVLLSISVFGKQYYGFQQTLLKYATMLSYICIFGYSSTVFILGQKYNETHPGRGVFLRLTLIVPCIISLITVAGMFVFKEKVLLIFNKEDYPVMRKYYGLFASLMFINVIMMWFEGYLLALNKSAVQTFIREILIRIINVILIVLFCVNVLDFSLFIYLYTFLYVIPLLILFYLVKKDRGFYFYGSASLLSRKEKSEIYNFSFFHMLSVVSMVLIFQIDAFLIPPLATNGLADFAIYSVAVFGVALMRNPTKVIGQAVTPSLAQAYNEGRLKDIAKIYKATAINMQIISLVIFLLVVLNIDKVMLVLGTLKPGYDMAGPVLIILTIGQVIEMSAGPNFELIGVTKYYRFNFWIAVMLLIVIIGLDIWLIQSMGITGAAWATTTGLIIFNLSKAFFLWKKFKILPVGRETLYIALIGCAVFALVWVIPATDNSYLDILIRSLTAGLLLWFALFKCKVSAELNELTRNILFKRKLF